MRAAILKVPPAQQYPEASGDNNQDANAEAKIYQARGPVTAPVAAPPIVRPAPTAPSGPRVGPPVDSTPTGGGSSSFFQDYKSLPQAGQHNPYYLTDLPAPLDTVALYPNGMARLSNGRWVTTDELERMYKEELRKRQEARGTQNVQVEGECKVGKYKEIEGTCGENGQAHHIVADYSLRYGTRPEAIAGQKRIPGMPSFGDGAAICLEGGAKQLGSEHNEAHVADTAIAGLGKNSTPPGTAAIGDIKAHSMAAVIAVKPKCEEKIRKEVDKAFKGVDPNRLGRTTQMPPTNSDTLNALQSGMTQGSVPKNIP